MVLVGHFALVIGVGAALVVSVGGYRHFRVVDGGCQRTIVIGHGNPVGIDNLSLEFHFLSRHSLRFHLAVDAFAVDRCQPDVVFRVFQSQRRVADECVFEAVLGVFCQCRRVARVGVPIVVLGIHHDVAEAWHLAVWQRLSAVR